MNNFDYKQAVYGALAPLGVPVKSIHSDSETYPSITFFVYDSGDDAGADNIAVEVGYSVQVDIWSKTEADSNRLRIAVLDAMASADFTDPHFQELYESDTQIYHIPCRFYYEFNTQ